ncbi:hypothetical protein VHEMI03078 [[Torrubiella] hemipterigena]|uniref:Xylanolytic transcriptional activator regulatory domain-containing protein n=1 Tax=[Torrubiella] hemipterigena TaxID=1531966 RepID=A0A0A1SXI7_9HYPO|nr:hypothetical protein VHEMI03078 [[Torrubiella] hemipterigena]
MLQSMGFHRSPTATRSHHPPEISAALVSRMWWAVVVRDCWVSLAKGRPMRIHTEDCDASKPLATYVSDELRQLPSSLLGAYLPRDIDALCDMWCTLVTISDNLGGIQRLHYKVTGPAPTRSQVDRYDRLLRDGAVMALDYSTLTSDELKIHYSQLQLSFQASVAILYRPFVLNSITSNEDPNWPKIAAERAHEAAASTNAILQRLIELDGIRYLRPMM